MTNADVVLSLMLDNVETHQVHMSFTLAKTMSQILGEANTMLETKGKVKVSTTREIDAALQGSGVVKES